MLGKNVMLGTICTSGRHVCGTDALDLLHLKHAVAVLSQTLHYSKAGKMTFCHSLSASHTRVTPDVRFHDESQIVVK